MLTQTGGMAARFFWGVPGGLVLQAVPSPPQREHIPVGAWCAPLCHFKASLYSGRRSLATKMLAKTGSMETVSLILGHEGGVDVSMRYVDVDPRVLRQAFTDVI